MTEALLKNDENIHKHDKNYEKSDRNTRVVKQKAPRHMDDMNMNRFIYTVVLNLTERSYTPPPVQRSRRGCTFKKKGKISKHGKCK